MIKGILLTKYNYFKILYFIILVFFKNVAIVYKT